MSGISGPYIVTDGLILYVDPGNPKCYISGSTTATDLIGQLTLTLNNGFEPPIQSYPNSWGFDGTDDYINVWNTGITSLTKASIVVWAAPESDNSNYEAIFSGRAGPADDDYVTGITIDQGDIEYVPRSSFSYLNCEGKGFTSAVDLLTSDIAFGTMTHLAITIEHGTNEVKLYVNGVAEGTRTASSPDMDFSYMQIGARYYGGGVKGYWDGKIGPLSIYNRVLSQEEINQNYNSQKSRFGL
jgi:hypothetical protein